MNEETLTFDLMNYYRKTTTKEDNSQQNYLVSQQIAKITADIFV